MQLNSTTRLGLCNALLCFLLAPVTSVQGIEIDGIDINQIKNPIYSSGTMYTPISADHLDELLDSCFVPNAHIHHHIAVSLVSGKSDNSASSSELTNTDLESITMEEEMKNEESSGKQTVFFSLNSLPTKNDSRKKYLLRENEIDVDAGSFTKNLCTKLAQDACHIANTHTSAITRSATTCLCVVLRDEQNRAKKFVFHNGKERLHTTMAQKAQELNYAIRTGLQAHAEAVFIQFLLQRSEQNEARYTHILGMGCSRRHCKECDCLFNLFLGKQYHLFTAAMKEQPALPVVTNVGGGCEIVSNVQAALVYASNAVNNEGKKSERYYLPPVLREHIQKKVALRIDFSNDRFVSEHEEAVLARRERSDKKRKASAL